MRNATLTAVAALLVSLPVAAEQFDIVLKGGRVVDPETGLDAIRDVGVRGDRIASISGEPLDGARIIDATGLVVAPGFIDLHQHQQDAESYRLKALDGVTTALELETGVPDLARFVEARRGNALINFGATASHEAARVLAWDQPLPPSTFGPAAGIPDPPESPVTADAASPEQLNRLLQNLRAQLDAGALGIGLGLQYTPGATRHEVVELFRLAAEYQRPVFAHIRSSGILEPGSGIEALVEVIGAAAVTGAPLHVVHVNSMCARQTPECLDLILGARARGLDVTVEAYPYGAFMTFVNSAAFSEGWREREGMDYDDVVLPDTGERLTKERFDALHASPEPIVVLGYLNPDEVVDAIVEHPLVMIASDGIKEHPRNAGSYARTYSRYVGARKSLGLMDAVRKMSLMPAQRLETATAAAQRKGRLQPGADADIVVFDPAEFRDRASYTDSTAPSVGVHYLLVGGTLVVDRGRIVEGVAPGRALTADVVATAVASPATGTAQGRPQVEFLNSGKVTPTTLPFSEAVRVGDTLLLSGQIGIRPGIEELILVPGGIEAEARQTLENIRATLEIHGYSLRDVVKCTVMLADIAEWARFNAVYRTFFSPPYPARSALGATGLALGARVEVECIAVRGAGYKERLSSDGE